MVMRVLVVTAAAGVLAAGLGCSNEPKAPSRPAALSSAVDSTINEFQSTDPGLTDLLNRSPGFAVFPDVGKAGFIVGGGYGSGEVFQGHTMIGYCDIIQGSVGLQIGAQDFAEILVFRDQGALDSFRDGEFSLSADASAIAIKPGVAAEAQGKGGVMVFVKPRGGLMAEASVGGQKFRFRPVNGGMSDTGMNNPSTTYNPNYPNRNTMPQ